MGKPNNQGVSTFIVLTRSRSYSVRRPDVKTGTKLREDRSRKSLGENVGELRSGGNMKNADITKSIALPNEVEINLNMLGALMLNGV